MHIVMELVPGGELFDAISTRTRLNEMTVNRLTGQLIRTLVYLHKSGIVHRDLKPENILLTSRNVDEADIKIAGKHIAFFSSRFLSEPPFPTTRRLRPLMHLRTFGETVSAVWYTGLCSS